jgi:hypothetical protein
MILIKPVEDVHHTKGIGGLMRVRIAHHHLLRRALKGSLSQ